MSTENLPEVQSTAVADQDQILARYIQLRAVGLELNNKLVSRLPTTALQDGGRRLGILRRGVLVFDSEHEMSVLMDYCLHDVRFEGRNTIEQYLIDSPPDPDSDEMTCLRAMIHATYSVFVVESVEPGFAVTARDIFSNLAVQIVDVGLSTCAKAGDFFASRLLQQDGFSMTGGAPLPIGWVPLDEQPDMIRLFSQALADAEHGVADPAELIRACLKRGTSSRVRYEDPAETLVAPRIEPISNHAPKIGRNKPCPCGSGKKFKHCCLHRSRPLPPAQW